MKSMEVDVTDAPTLRQQWLQLKLPVKLRAPTSSPSQMLMKMSSSDKCTGNRDFQTGRFGAQTSNAVSTLTKNNSNQQTLSYGEFC